MAIRGAILGDILGSKYEFDRPKNLDWENVKLYDPTKADVTYTDDTVMTLAIKKAILENKDLIETMQYMGLKYPDAGYGERFYQWLRSDGKPYNSWGNGSAMRVAFIGEYFNDIKDVQAWAKKSAAVSHNHPEGVKGAVVTATCIWMAKHKMSKEDIYKFVLKVYPPEQYKFSGKDLDYLRFHCKWSVHCADCVPVAMRCFYESDSYESFIRNVISMDCDTDTIAAIGGGVAEEFYGGTGLDEEVILQDVLDTYLYNLLTR